MRKVNDKLREENETLKRELAVCLNEPLLREIKSAVSRLERGQFVDKEEFLKDSPLVC